MDSAIATREARSYTKSYVGVFSLCFMIMATELPTTTTATHHENGDLEEYCEFETFRPQCMKNEVVVIERAIYGRRYLSRCLETEEFDFKQHPEFLGCSADAVGYLSSKCSGKNQCEIRIPDPDLQQTKPCPKGLDMFLEVYYSCVEVVEDDRSCSVSLSSSPLHIGKSSSSSAVQSVSHGLSCGTKDQPWLLESPIGQRITLSLVEFTTSSAVATTNAASSAAESVVTKARASHVTGRTLGSCSRPQLQYGYVYDKSVAATARKNVSICGNEEGLKVSHVYLSDSNILELVLQRRLNDNSSSSAFLIRVEAVGCSDLIPPEDAWIQRTENTVIVGCYTSRQTWHLKCEDRQWIGVISNCSTYVADNVETFVKATSDAGEILNEHQVLPIVAIAFLGLAVCLMIICCGVNCWRRYTPKQIARCEEDAGVPVTSIFAQRDQSCVTYGDAIRTGV